MAQSPQVCSLIGLLATVCTRNSSGDGDEIANVNFFTTTSSTTFAHSTPEATEFREITQNKDILPFEVIQGHQCWYQSGRKLITPIPI